MAQERVFGEKGENHRCDPTRPPFPPVGEGQCGTTEKARNARGGGHPAMGGGGGGGEGTCRCCVKDVTRQQAPPNPLLRMRGRLVLPSLQEIFSDLCVLSGDLSYTFRQERRRNKRRKMKEKKTTDTPVLSYAPAMPRHL